MTFEGMLMCVMYLAEIIRASDTSSTAMTSFHYQMMISMILIDIIIIGVSLKYIKDKLVHTKNR